MAQYIKPGIKLVTITNPVREAGSCTTSGEDLALLKDIYGIADWNTAFSMTEPCADQYPIEEYCKFTSVESGLSTVILQS